MGGKSEKTWFGPCFVFITLGDLGVLKCRNSNAKTRFLVNCQLIIVTFPGGNPSPEGLFFLREFFTKTNLDSGC